jgi:hypothetical protein
VLHAQTGVWADDLLAQRAARLQRVLPDTPPALKLMRRLSAEEVSARILAAVRIFRCVAGCGQGLGRPPTVGGVL